MYDKNELVKREYNETAVNMISKNKPLGFRAATSYWLCDLEQIA